MYIPDHFAVDAANAQRMVAEVVAGDLVTCTSSGLSASFLPLLFEPSVSEHGSLRGHVARNNPVWREAPWGEALVIVNGPNAYVSPSWYASKAEHGRVVPTWNYVALHIHGELVVHDDVAWVGALVRGLTERHEAGRSQPWTVDDAPPSFVAGQLRAIVGVEVVITRVEAKVKMSQNRPPADIDGVVSGLRDDGLPVTADLVERLRP